MVITSPETTDGDVMSAAILAATETMSDRERWRHMLDLGRRALANGRVKADIAALSCGPSYYQRRLSVMASYASGDRDLILAALTGASAALAALAMKVAVRRLDTETLAAVLPDLPPSRRQVLARACADMRPAVVERAFARLSVEDQLRLVAYAGAGLVKAQLADADFVDRLAFDDWSRIARRHPSLALGAITDRLGEVDEPSRTLLTALNGVILGAVAVDAPGALALLQAAAARSGLGALRYDVLARHFPGEVAALVLADGRTPWITLRRIDVATLKALIIQRGRGVAARELRALPPANRQALYEDGLFEPDRDAAGALPADMVALLPSAARIAEARRAWAAPQYRAHPESRLLYLAFLPYAEALNEAAPHIADPDGDIRAIAAAAVVGSGRYEASRLGEILAFVHARRNEQDPVRLAMIGALASLPPTRWRNEHLAGLSQVIDAALAARDVSASTLDATGRLLIQMAPSQIRFVGRELSRVAEKLGRVPYIRLEDRLSDTQMAVLAAELMPLLQVWRDRSQIYAVTSLLRNFGRRLKASAPLIEFLVDLTKDPRGEVAGAALETLFSAQVHARLRTLVPELLKRDPSWILTRGVAPWVSQSRQDLLTPFLTPKVYKGRFNYHRTAVLPSFGGGYHRWTERQQRTFGAALIQIAGSGRRSTWEMRGALDQIAAMPAGDAGPIASAARLNAEDKALRDMAVVALGKLDGARGVTALVEALDDDRGRIAIYALRRAVLDMPATEAIAFLRRAPLRKVTVAKEVIRLAGEVGGDAGWDFLSGVTDQPDIHKDVRIAVLRALWSYLERHAVWDIFAEAAAADAGAARASVHIPEHRLSAAARSRLARHLQLLLGHESEIVRLEALKRLAYFPIQPAGAGLTGELIRLLDSATEEEAGYVAAALALGVPLGDVGDLAPILADGRTPRVLQAIVSTLATQHAAHFARIEPLSQRLVDKLIDEKRQITLATRLAVRALPPPALEAVLRRMSTFGLLHPGALAEALTGLRLKNTAGLGDLDTTLAAADDPMLRRIALAALTSRAEKLGWSQTARASLEACRTDGSPMVSEAADLVFPSDEMAAA